LIKKHIITFLKILISCSLIYYLLHKIGVGNIVEQFLSLEIFWFITGLLIFTASNFLGSLQWKLILDSHDVRLSFRKVLSYYYAGLFFNNFLIGYVGGDAIRIYDISRNTNKTSAAIASVILDRFIGFVLLTTMALLGALLWINNEVSAKILPILLIILAGWLLLIFLLFNKSIVGRYITIFKKLIPKQLINKISEIYNAIHAFQDKGDVLVKISMISIFTQGLRIFVHYVAARSIGVKLDIVYFIIFVPIIALISSLPISIGGIGVRETSGVALFTQAGAVESDVVAFEFIAYLIGIVSTLPGGIVFMFRKDYKEPLTTGGILE